MKKSTAKEVALRRLIRKIVREEIEKQQESINTQEFTMTDEFYEPEISDDLDEPWAIFGQPEIDPQQEKKLQKEQPKLLPSWKNQPYHPNFHDFDTPPLLFPRPDQI